MPAIRRKSSVSSPLQLTLPPRTSPGGLLGWGAVWPGAALERRERPRAIINAVRTARMPRNHRCALWAWLRDRLGKWAAGRGIPAATARVWAKRARDVLRAHLVATGLAPDAA